MINLVQNFLRNGGTVEQLQERFKVKVKAHGLYPNLLQFKYDQIESPMHEPIVQQCRGMILDSANNWEIVAWPFNKFFNYGEGHAAKIDWETAEVQEKLDGSLIIMYHYDGKWNVATSGTPDASGEVNGCGVTFAELFWRVWSESGYDLPEKVYSPNVTYMFELMTPYNRVVVRHGENRIVEIGERWIRGCTEANAMFAEYGSGSMTEDGDECHLPGLGGCVDWEGPIPHIPSPVRSFPLQSIDDIQRTFEKMDPLQQEGYVVVDDNFNRVKVKHPGYVAIHHLRDGFGPKRILELVRTGEVPEFLAHFPEWTDVFNEVKTRYDYLVQHLEMVYEANRHRETQKDFALWVKDEPCSGALFSLRAGKVSSIKQWLAQVNIKSLMETLKLKDIEL